MLMTCPICNSVFESITNKKYCSTNCRRKQKNKIQKKNIEEIQCNNPNCNCSFIPKTNQKYCSKSCSAVMEKIKKKREPLPLIEKTCANIKCKKVFFTNIYNKAYCCAQCQIVGLNRNIKINLYEKNRKKIDVQYKLKKILRSRITNAIKNKNGKKIYKTKELLGCSSMYVQDYLESLFQPGMSWDNHGLGDDKWHIDHIVPLDAFDLTNPEEQKKACHYTNLQPLWQKDNLRKSNKII